MREAGITALETVIVAVVFGIAMLAILSSLDNATHAHTFSQRRNEALDDLRIMANVFAKDVRQGIEASVISPTQFTFETYIDTEVHEVTWRAVPTVDGDRLERVIDGSVASVYVVDLTTTSVFSYFGEAVPDNVSRVRIALATQPDDRFASVGIETEVEMRNVG